MLWVLIRSASLALLMSTHNIDFCGETKNIRQGQIWMTELKRSCVCMGLSLAVGPIVTEKLTPQSQWILKYVNMDDCIQEAMLRCMQVQSITVKDQ